MAEDANLEALVAALAPPPGHSRPAPDYDPIPGGLVFQITEPLAGPRDAAHRERLASASLRSIAHAPSAEDTDALIPARLVSAGGTVGGAVTEAVADQAAHPVSAVGRVTAFFNGRVRYCTGSVVAERVVLTAAHCVYTRSTSVFSEPRFADWIRFEPQYKADENAGSWAADSAYIHKGWADPVHASPGTFDYAFIRLDAPILSVTGSVSLLANTQPEGPFTSLGYPRQPSGDFKYDGRFLFATTGERVYENGSLLVKAENGLTEGSSGGPWFTSEAGQLSVGGLNSTKPINNDRYTWSPPFNEGFLDLLARVLADMTGV